MDICDLGSFGDLKVLDKLEETNKLVVVGVVEGHVDVSNTRFIYLALVVGVADVVMVTAVPGARMDTLALGG